MRIDFISSDTSCFRVYESRGRFDNHSFISSRMVGCACGSDRKYISRFVHVSRICPRNACHKRVYGGGDGGFIFFNGGESRKKLKAVCFIAPVLSEAIMTTGYFLYEWALFGLAPATANLIYSLMQATASLVLGFLLLVIFIKRDLRKKIFSGKKHE